MAEQIVEENGASFLYCSETVLGYSEGKLHFVGASSHSEYVYIDRKTGKPLQLFPRLPDPNHGIVYYTMKNGTCIRHKFSELSPGISIADGLNM